MSDDDLVFEAPRKVPQRLQTCMLEGITENGSFDAVRRYAANLPRYLQSGVGLLLSGPNGVGKSGALAAVTASVRRYKPSWGSRNIVWCRATDIATLYGYGKEDGAFGIPVDELYNTARWLVIDELGRETTKNHDTRLIQLFGIRTQERRVTSFTTNLSLDPKDPAGISKYGPAFMSLLHQACVFETTEGPDRRVA